MFIVIDGPDGSGKSTLARRLTGQLKQNGSPAICTCEPTYDSEAGQKLRQLLKTGSIDNVYTFADLFVEDRKVHITSLIEPALEKGIIVVCDRYKYSSLAYQQLQGVDADYLIESNRPCLVPDFTFILLPQDADVLLRRIAHRGEERDIFEKREFLLRTLECYRKLPSWFPDEHIIFLDAETAIEENLDKIISIINEECISHL